MPPLAARSSSGALVALGVGVVLWLPPTIDQLIHHPGNETILIKHFTNPPADEPTVGVRGSLQYVFEKLDVAHLSVHQLASLRDCWCPPIRRATRTRAAA